MFCVALCGKNGYVQWHSTDISAGLVLKVTSKTAVFFLRKLLNWNCRLLVIAWQLRFEKVIARSLVASFFGTRCKWWGDVTLTWLIWNILNTEKYEYNVMVFPTKSHAVARIADSTANFVGVTWPRPHPLSGKLFVRPHTKFEVSISSSLVFEILR